MGGTTIFSDFLQALGVAHTGVYSDGRFHGMAFKSLFGFSRLLTEYGVANTAMRLADASDLAQLPTPFLAQRSDGFVIVNGISTGHDGKPDSVDYTFYHSPHKEDWDGFVSTFEGVVLTASPGPDSAEPDYRRHSFAAVMDCGKRWLLALLALTLMVAGVIYSGAWRHVSLICLLATDIAGLTVTYLLVLKTLNVANHTADKVCGLLKEHGCDTVLEQKASTFFGIFSWSEVGMAYFAVSTFVLLAFPDMTVRLALVNGCCLPFTVWSIWYQRFRIHTWCTLCVITQGLLWMQFLCFLCGGWWNGVLSGSMVTLIPLICAYGAVLLGLNRVDNFIKSSSARQ
ncbi:MAG: vitamin K epoxide reductase family protein [Muribaculaceae bacterium]|nr:vitamin K epoxide reductase family protein [Muribaculaceae bacterium]